jgi:arylsulfatase A-like enzyme
MRSSVSATSTRGRPVGSGAHPPRGRTVFHRTAARGASVLLPIVLGSAALAMGCGGAQPTRPDVVLVVVDSLRADHLDHLGYERATAAPLDDFRARATLFTNAWAPAPSTVPSVASLFTGLLGVGYDAFGRRPAIPPSVPTLAETLAERGWTTAAVPHHVDVDRKSGFARGFDRFDVYAGTTADYPDAGEMVRWVREWLADAPDGPFFLYLHPMNVHAPYRVPPAHAASLLGRAPKSDLATTVRTIMRDRRTDLRSSVKPARVKSLVDQYDTAIHYTTGRIAEVLDLLENAGRLDDALVIVTADHGEELFDHGGFGHGYTLYHEVLHVPLYVKLPRQQLARTVAAPVSLVDVFPTVLDALGIPPRTTDGISLLAALRGEPLEPRDRRIYHQLRSLQRGIARAVVEGRYKLIDVTASYDGLRDDRLLFDLILDPAERNDLSEQGSEIADRLAAELDREFERLDRRQAP